MLGNSTQYSVKTYMGKNLKEEYRCMPAASFCCTLETNTTLKINCTPVLKKCKPAWSFLTW